MASFSISLNTAGLEDYFRALGDDAQAAVRPAAQAGAEVLYQAARANVAKIERRSGRLAGSIYQAYSRSESDRDTATYYVSWRTNGNGGPRAPHGHLIEHGHWQYYVVYRDKAGRMRTAIRPEMRGKPKPKGRRRSRAVMDSYYQPLPGGPRWVPAQPFIRPAMAKSAAALDAAAAELMRRWKGST
jgi:hypothetical protein